MYTKAYRNKVQNLIISFAEADERITDCAIVGSESIGENDQWSDIDLTFGVDNEVEIPNILSDWNRLMSKHFGANALFDLGYKESIYRVYLLPNVLQVDLSFTPTKHFGALTKKFKLVFGKEKKRRFTALPQPKTIYGYAVLYALKTRCSLERGKPWQAHHYLEKFKDYILMLKCLSDNLIPFEGRGYDKLSNSFLKKIQSSLITSPSHQEIKKSLQILIAILISEFDNDTGIDYNFENELEMIGDVDGDYGG